MSECPREAAVPLLTWLIRVAIVKPYLFHHFVAVRKGVGVELARFQMPEEDLLQRCRRTERLPRSQPQSIRTPAGRT